jgi:chorismate mutase
VAVRAVRGATQLEVDEREHLLERTAELVRAVLDRNGIAADDLISIVFTATPDLTSEFPAYAARSIGITDVPLLCARELDVADAMPRVVRLLAHVQTDLRRADVRHVYLHGARALRIDLPHDEAGPGT